MGCGFHKSSKTFLSKSDLIELQKHPDELNEKRMKILQWMENHVELSTKSNHYKKEKENEQFAYWQEEWQREQQLVDHPSLIDSCDSKMPCITLIEDNLRVLCRDETDNFWKDFEEINPSN